MNSKLLKHALGVALVCVAAAPLARKRRSWITMPFDSSSINSA